MDHQNELYKENVFFSPNTVTHDANRLPLWCGDGGIDSYFGPNPQILAIDDDGEGALSRLYDEGLYVRFLCSGASDAVWSCLGIKEVILSMVPAANKALYARMRDTAPVFSRLKLCDWLLDLGGGFVKHIGDGVVLSAQGLFGYKNPRGLRSVAIKYSKSLSEWLATVPWEALRVYLEQNTQLLESVVLGDGTDPNERIQSGKGGDVQSEAERLALAQVEPQAIGPLKRLFASFVTAKQFVAESAPFTIDVAFITNLTRMIRDLRLYDERLRIETDDLSAIRGHFGSLQRFGVPAGRVPVRELVQSMEGHVDELLIRNLDNKQQLTAQEVTLLFERFKAVELDSSLMTDWPTSKSKAKIRALSIRADTHNFFIPLLNNVPASVRTLTIKNATFSSNNLIIDLAQKHKFQTGGVETLVLEGFADNLKQIWKVLHHQFFPALRHLVIHFVPSDRDHRDHRAKEEEIRRKQAATPRLHTMRISTVFRESKY